MATLDDKARARLIALLGMLGSEHAGERDAAALQAEALRKRLGMSWEEMVGKTMFLQPGIKTVYVNREVVVEREVVREVRVWAPSAIVGDVVEFFAGGGFCLWIGLWFLALIIFGNIALIRAIVLGLLHY